MKKRIFYIVLKKHFSNRWVCVIFNRDELIGTTEYLMPYTKCRENRCCFKRVSPYNPLFWMRYCKCNIIKNKEPIFFNRSKPRIFPATTILRHGQFIVLLLKET